MGEPGWSGLLRAEIAALRTATQLASAMIRVCSDAGREGSIFLVDANLRPEGRSGPLVRTLASHLAYYQRRAKTCRVPGIAQGARQSPEMPN